MIRTNIIHNDYISQANDHDVVHVYRDEQIDGTKTFTQLILGSISGNAGTATTLQTARKINGTAFNGSKNITTATWGTARNVKIQDAYGDNVGEVTVVNGSTDIVVKLPKAITADISGNITGDIVGNAASATKLLTAVDINGTSFDGSSSITTTTWGTSRTFTLQDNSGTNKTTVNVDGGSSVTLKLPATIKSAVVGNLTGNVTGDVTGNLIGNASTATTLATKRTINGTDFNGSANITTATWGTARNITIKDATAANAAAAVSVNGGSDVVLKLPATIQADIVGNVTGNLTGDVTGNVSGNLTGNADTATVLATARTINGTSFDGSKNITTTKWGAARNLTLTDGTNSAVVSIDGSKNITLTLPSTLNVNVTGDIVGNATTATSAVNDSAGNKIDDTYATKAELADSVGNILGSAPEALDTLQELADALNNDANFATNVTNALATKAVDSGVVHNTGNETIAGTKTFKSAIVGNLNGTASNATVLATARRVYITDATDDNSGNTVMFDGSADVVLRLPENIRANIIGNITGDVDGNIETASRLATARTINGTAFDGSKNIVTSYWGANRTFSISDVNGTNEGTSVSVNGSTNVSIPLPRSIEADITGSVTGKLTGNADTATKLQSPVNINDTVFDGTGNITTAKWGSLSTMQVTDADGTNGGEVIDVDGGVSTYVLKLPGTIKATITGDVTGNLVGNASTATTLQTARTINGTSFNGSKNITTVQWGTARNISISDYYSKYTGDISIVDGSTDVTLKLPDNITANIVGNASTATNATNDELGNNIVNTYATREDLDNSIARLIDSAPEALNTLNELSSAINNDANFAANMIDLVATKAADTTVVHITGDETIAGTKTYLSNIVGGLTGNASTATTLQTARTINGTSFNGSKNITTTLWGTARNISISDADSTNTGDSMSVNGSSDVVLKLPRTIKAAVEGTVTGNVIGNLIGNANTATEFSSGKDITLTGNVIGATNSTGGWSIATTISSIPCTAEFDITADDIAKIIV